LAELKSFSTSPSPGSVAEPEPTAIGRQSRRRACGERLLDELATGETSLGVHAFGAARDRINYLTYIMQTT